MKAPTKHESTWLDRSAFGRWVAKNVNPGKHVDAKGSFPVEYRVHVVNGKVIPFATSAKWSDGGYLNTFSSARKARIERQLQKDIDRILASNTETAKRFKLKDHVLGLDVGVDPKTGKAIVYEMNPSMPVDENAGSAQLMIPWVRHAINSSIRGELSWPQRLQLMAGVAPTAAGAGMMASGAGNLRDRRH